jgi:iron(III) transport system substrate-binding protein
MPPCYSDINLTMEFVASRADSRALSEFRAMRAWRAPGTRSAIWLRNDSRRPTVVQRQVTVNADTSYVKREVFLSELILRIVLVIMNVNAIYVAANPCLPIMINRLNNRSELFRGAGVVILVLLSATTAFAQDRFVNLYSARHYQTDEALYNGFTQLTGIRINRIEGAEDALLERLKNEGPNSPADVLITVDVARLWRAQQMHLFQPVTSAVLERRIPPNLRERDGHWFGFSKRARVIVYNKRHVKPADVQRYEDLAEPGMKGKICTRSLSHVYNLSLMSGLIDNLGEARARQWAKGIKANLARDPKGGDTDQIKSVAAGECQVAIVNTYYYARLASSKNPDDRAVADRVGLIFPNQKSFGTHINISGGGVLRHAPHRENAIRFLEYLASDEAQSYFANGNNEWPAVPGITLTNPALAALGAFREDPLSVGILGQNQPLAQKVLNVAGLK